MTSETTTLARPDGRGDDMSNESCWARCTIERVTPAEARSAEQCACCHATESLRLSRQGDLLCFDEDACVARRREQLALAGDPTKEEA